MTLFFEGRGMLSYYTNLFDIYVLHQVWIETLWLKKLFQVFAITLCALKSFFQTLVLQGLSLYPLDRWPYTTASGREWSLSSFLLSGKKHYNQDLLLLSIFLFFFSFFKLSFPYSFWGVSVFGFFFLNGALFWVRCDMATCKQCSLWISV